MNKYFVCLLWDVEKQALNWQIHNGINTIKRGFKTRKAARQYVIEILKGAY